jgi:transcriptional regulator with XRE-family HTH domain
MKFSAQMTDEGILQELGSRLAQIRLERNLTQANLAEQAGISKRTVERLESGEVASQLSALIRVCRALEIVERLETLLPEPIPSPIALLKMQGRKRQRASGKQSSVRPTRKWTWGESS